MQKQEIQDSIQHISSGYEKNNAIVSSSQDIIFADVDVDVDVMKSHK